MKVQLHGATREQFEIGQTFAFTSWQKRSDPGKTLRQMENIKKRSSSAEFSLSEAFPTGVPVPDITNIQKPQRLESEPLFP
jgi:hypothetical protein